MRELGAEVRVCAPPDEEFVALLTRAGLPPVPNVRDHVLTAGALRQGAIAQAAGGRSRS